MRKNLRSIGLITWVIATIILGVCTFNYIMLNIDVKNCREMKESKSTSDINKLAMKMDNLTTCDSANIEAREYQNWMRGLADIGLIDTTQEAASIYIPKSDILDLNTFLVSNPTAHIEGMFGIKYEASGYARNTIILFPANSSGVRLGNVYQTYPVTSTIASINYNTILHCN